ncbi:MAG: flagellar assembly peptidoglycan hydrolase FlgJ [Sedimenticola sp.]|nr:flagellar assembly peptidoglycan hydrolase FlgJ [Sedimenticola sp.]
MDMPNASIYTSMEGLTALKARASTDASGSLDEVARQFESLFVQQMLKSMRQAGLGEGLMDNDQSLFYRDMYDQQLAIHLSESGGMGLADVIKRQLGGAEASEDAKPTMPVKSIEDYQRMAMALRLYQAPEPNDESDIDLGATEAKSMTEASAQVDPKQWSPDEFVEHLLPWATEAAGVLGLKPHALLAQAALETGWGKHLIRTPDGTPANNLFGIKADKRWDGDRVSVNTLEYEQGAAVKRRAYFRSYESLRDSFHDYVDFLQSNPRYEKALESTTDSASYFTALQRAGYATDPEYANKINAVMNGAEMTRALEKLKLEENQPI